MPFSGHVGTTPHPIRAPSPRSSLRPAARPRQGPSHFAGVRKRFPNLEISGNSPRHTSTTSVVGALALSSSPYRFFCHILLFVWMSSNNRKKVQIRFDLKTTVHATCSGCNPPLGRTEGLRRR